MSERARIFVVPVTLFPPVPSATLLRVWAQIGTQSWGGGPATLALIRQAVVVERQWVSEADFARGWALCQMSPGINQIGLTILLGRQIAGTRGIAICLLGLLTPSVLLTVAVTAGYAAVRGNSTAQAALRGAIPATVGIGLFTALQMATATLKESAKEGKVALAFSGILLATAIAVAAFTQSAAVAVLLGAAAVGALQGAVRNRQSGGMPP